MKPSIIVNSSLKVMTGRNEGGIVLFRTQGNLLKGNCLRMSTSLNELDMTNLKGILKSRKMGPAA